MAKQKYVKVQVNLAIGNRSSKVTDPIEVDEDSNCFDGELNTLLLNFVDAVKAIPTVGGNYTTGDIIESVCSVFDLQKVPLAVPQAG